MDDEQDTYGRENFPDVVEAVIDRLREAASSENNPLYIWQAIGFVLLNREAHSKKTGGLFSEEVTVPRWTAEFLFHAIRNLNALAGGRDFNNPEVMALSPDDPCRPPDISAEQAMKLVPSALGFTRNGWNAFAASQADRQKQMEFLLYQAEYRSGASSIEALRLVQQKFGLKSERQTRRRIAEGKKLIYAGRSGSES